MPMRDPFEEKSQRFFPAEIYFWVLNTLGWIFALTLINPGAALPPEANNGQFVFRPAWLATVWLAHYIVGTLILLIFRRLYYRQRWYQRKFIGSLPLVILVALAGGMAMAVLVVLPLDLMRDGDFNVYNQAGQVVYDGVLAVTLFNSSEYAFLVLLWLLAYLGIEGPINARNLVRRALALENSLKDAKLNALAGQINPHFLFNALNNIRFMIGRDAERAEQSLVDLAEILRHSLEASQQAKALLAKELIVVERYLGLMKIQMQHRLEYSIQTADVPEHVLVPPMIIQMLAENAIKHGVEQVREGGRVDINCRMEAGKLCIEVKNSTAASASESAGAGTMTSAMSASGKGVGLGNIRKRLSLLYGDNAQLSMYQREGCFLARITLPAEGGA